MPNGTEARASARQRLLDAANELFYREGVQSVGIDRIIEHAGVAKGSLYKNFGSKEELVRAYLETRHAGTSERVGRALTRFGTPRERLLGVFDAQGELFAQPDFNGCAFVAASAEAPPGSSWIGAADDYRSWVRGIFLGLAEEAGALDPDSLARQLHLLYDGAGLAARMDRDPSAAATARTAAAGLFDAAPKADRPVAARADG